MGKPNKIEVLEVKREKSDGSVEINYY
jgi:hypothetical protein